MDLSKIPTCDLVRELEKRAAENPEIGARQLRQLHDRAYPEFT